jgi:hypothetical protein
MAQGRLAKILEQEYKTKGVVSGTVSALGKRTREKLSLRNALFGGSGIGSVIGRKIFGKGYSATPESSVVSKMTTPEQTFSSEAVNVLSTIAGHAATSAKNSIVLPSMARDMHLVKQNIAKLVRISGETPQTKSGDWLSRQMARETAYEESLKKTPTQVKPTEKKEKDSKNPFMQLFSALAANIPTVVKGLTDSIQSLITSVVSGIGGALSALLSGPGFIGALLGVAMAAMYTSKSAKESRRLDELSKKKDSEMTKEETKEYNELKERSVARNEEATRNYQKSGEFGDDMMRGLGIPGYEEPETPTQVKPVSETGSEKEALDFFIKKGWTPAQSAGIVANLKNESQFKTDAVGDNGKAYGIAQWHPDRQEKFKEVMGKPIQQSNFKEQLNFVDWELRNSEKRAGELLKKTTTPAEAAKVVDEKYERSKGLSLAKRMKDAEIIAQQTTPGAAVQVASVDLKNTERGSMAAPVVINAPTNNNVTQKGGGGSSPSPEPPAMDSVFAQILIST